MSWPIDAHRRSAICIHGSVSKVKDFRLWAPYLECIEDHVELDGVLPTDGVVDLAEWFALVVH